MAEIGTSVDPVRSSTDILAQLLSYTRQMAAYETKSDVNIAALTRACGSRLEDLKKVLPGALESSKDKTGIQGLIREVQAQVELSTKVVEKIKVEASRKLASLSKTRNAIRAYSR